MYYILYGFLYILSLLPLRVLYIIGDGVYGLLYYIIKYRRTVVMGNLSIAFPGKTEAEKTIIAKAFYHNFIDTFIEVIKMLSITDKQAAKRVTGDFSGFEKAYPCGKNIQVHALHNFNWEIVQWAVAKNLKYPFLGVYMPISNNAINRIFYDLRKRCGTVLIAATNFKNEFAQCVKEKYVLALAADQNPGKLGNAYWLSFFGRPTPFLSGPEKGARMNDTAVVFVTFYKTRRGHYHLTSELVTTAPNDLAEGELTRRFVNYVETTICNNPANYLWSHRRWKHDWKPDYQSQWYGPGLPAAPAIV